MTSSHIRYCTISSGTADPGRALKADNNPSGHNTLIVRQASPEYNAAVVDGNTNFPVETLPKWGTKDEASFSQFNDVKGEIKLLTNVTLFGRGCIDADGSAVYGSDRAAGWLDVFHRYACPLPGGGFLLIDVRSSMLLSEETGWLKNAAVCECDSVYVWLCAPSLHLYVFCSPFSSVPLYSWHAIYLVLYILLLLTCGKFICCRRSLHPCIAIDQAFSVKPNREAISTALFDETSDGTVAAYQSLDIDSYVVSCTIASHHLC